MWRFASSFKAKQLLLKLLLASKPRNNCLRLSITKSQKKIPINVWSNQFGSWKKKGEINSSKYLDILGSITLITIITIIKVDIKSLTLGITNRLSVKLLNLQTKSKGFNWGIQGEKGSKSRKGRME